MIQIIQTIAAIALVFLIPGYLFSRLLFSRLELVERISLSAGFSIIFTVFLAFLLTMLKNLRIGNGITAVSVWGSLIVLTLGLGYLVYRRK